MRSLRPIIVVAFVAVCGTAFAQIGSGNSRNGGRTGSQPTSAQQRDAALQRLSNAVPTVQAFKVNNKVSRLYGVPFATGFTPEQAASKFVTDYSAIFEPGTGKLVHSGTQDVMDGKFTAVYFRETVMGLPLDQGYLTVLVRNEPGSPVVLVSSSVQTVAKTALFGANLTANQAIAAVRNSDPSLSAIEAPVKVAYQDGDTTRIAWSFLASNNNKRDMKGYRAYVDATNGNILEMRDEVFDTNVSGHVGGWATPGLDPNQIANPPALADLPGSTVRIQGGSTTLAGAGGNFVLSNPGSAPVTVIASLRGQWVNVLNDAGPNETEQVFAIPPGPANLTFNQPPQTEFVQSQVDAFIQVTAVHDFAKAINPAYPGIDLAIPTNVNIASICNAFYFNDSVNFFASETGDGMTGCPNTAYSTVVWHEYGHFIIDHGHPSPTGDYHEGMADVTASLLADSACLGNDFLGQGGGCLRSAVNAFTYPCFGEAHDCGMVISGAFWGTRVNMIPTLGNPDALDHTRYLYLNSILLHPSGINPGITIDVLTLDDDNPIIWDGTPNYAEIAAAFNAKNLTAPTLDTSYDVSSVTTIQGTHNSGATAEALSSDNTYYVDDSVLVPGIGYFATIQADFTIAESAASVEHLFFTIESHASPVGQATGTLLIWNWNSGVYEFAKAFSVGTADGRSYAVMTDGVSDYVSNTGQVRCAFRAHDPFRRAGARPQAFQLSTDYIHLHVKS